MPVGDLFKGPIPQPILDEITTKQNEIQELLQPYKVNITEDEKRHIPKAADETHPFLGADWRIDGSLSPGRP